MIYFEANVTTTIPNSPNMYSNNNAANSTNQQYLGDYSYQQTPQQQQQQHQQHQQHQQQHTILPPPGPGNQPNAAYSFQNNASGSSTSSASNIQGNANSNANSSNANSSNANSGNNSSNNNIANKFTAQDIQILKQLLVAGEKHKWKQITKEINQFSSTNTGNAPSDQNQQPFGNRHQGRNVSPTFVIKQYQSLLGLPNNANFFGSLASSLPYVVSSSGWDEVSDQNYAVRFGNEDIE